MGHSRRKNAVTQYVTDTQALLWHLMKNRKLSRTARKVFRRADAGDAQTDRRTIPTAAGPGLIRPPARSLGPGVLLVPGELRTAVLEALDEAGALYTETRVWLGP